MNYDVRQEAALKIVGIATRTANSRSMRLVRFGRSSTRLVLQNRFLRVSMETSTVCTRSMKVISPARSRC